MSEPEERVDVGDDVIVRGVVTYRSAPVNGYQIKIAGGFTITVPLQAPVRVAGGGPLDDSRSIADRLVRELSIGECREIIERMSARVMPAPADNEI